MELHAVCQPIRDVDADWLIIGAFDGDAQPPSAYQGSELAGLIQGLIDSKDLPTSISESTVLWAPAGLKVRAAILVGLGSREKFDAGVAYLVGVAAAKRLASKKRDRVAIVLPDSGGSPPITSALFEGLTVGTKGPDVRKSEPNRHEFQSLTAVASNPDSDLESITQAVKRGGIVGEAVNLARLLVNTPPSEKPPENLAARAKVAGEAAGVKVEVWDETRIRSERFGGLLGVAAGSEEPPAFVILEYKNGGDAPTIALVGKGVTFDSGGLSLKPSASMEDMKSDMTGAAVVLATMVAVARLDLPVNVVGYLALTENMVNGRAMKLGDVLKMRNGKTVEIMNTDAEGRLILADALSYAVEQSPAKILDLATLTGACMVALGTKVAGLFSNDDAFAEEVRAASKATGERTWRMPLDDDYRDQLKSPVADLKNVGGKWGGSITAAKFLEQFVASTPWVHLDIAGPSWADSDGATRDSGGSGCFVRTLVNLLETAARKGARG